MVARWRDILPRDDYTGITWGVCMKGKVTLSHAACLAIALYSWFSAGKASNDMFLELPNFTFYRNLWIWLRSLCSKLFLFCTILV